MKGKRSSEKNKRLKQEKSVYEAKAELVNKTIEQIKEVLKDPVKNKDSTDDLGDTIKDIFQPILDEFKDLIGQSEDKKSFICGLIKIFTILLSSRSTSLAEIKKVIGISTKIALDLWLEQKLQSED